MISRVRSGQMSRTECPSCIGASSVSKLGGLSGRALSICRDESRSLIAVRDRLAAVVGAG